MRNKVTEKENLFGEDQNFELQKFKFISDHSNDAHFLMDEKSRFNYVNKEACRRLGFTESELLKMSIPDIDPVFPIERCSEFFEKMKTLKPFPPFEGVHRRKDGSQFPVEVTSTYVQLGEKPYFFAQVRDITERQKTLELLNQKTKQLAESYAD